MKTETTLKLEELLQNHFDTRKDFYVFECTIGWYGKERVDCIMYNCDRIIHCYEIKQSKQDFYSKSALTFIGHKNYFVMPIELYEQVKKDIPKHIGVYASAKYAQDRWVSGTYQIHDGKNGFDVLVNVKPARSQELKANTEVILSSMLRCMQRDRYVNFFGAQEKDGEKE